MKKLLLIIVLVLAISQLFAQNLGKVVKTIKGKVINATTNEVISYTNIGLEGTFYGTASNAEGNFELKIPEEFVSKNIFFSAVGFKNEMLPVKQLFDKDFNIIKLEAKSYGINDVDIAAQSRVLIRILRMASENIPVNYIGGPVNFEGTYSCSKQTGTENQSYTSDVIIFDETAYSNAGILSAFKSRKYKLAQPVSGENNYRFLTAGTNMDELLMLDWVRSTSGILNPELIPDFSLKLKEEPQVDGVDCWLIFFEQKNPTFACTNDFYATSFEGEILIGKTDYDIKKISARLNSKKQNTQGKNLAISANNKNFYKNVKYNFIVTYKNLGISAIELNKNYRYNNAEVSESSKLLIDKINVTQVKPLKNRDYYTE